MWDVVYDEVRSWMLSPKEAEKDWDALDPNAFGSVFTKCISASRFTPILFAHACMAFGFVHIYVFGLNT